MRADVGPDQEFFFPSALHNQSAKITHRDTQSRRNRDIVISSKHDGSALHLPVVSHNIWWVPRVKQCCHPRCREEQVSSLHTPVWHYLHLFLNQLVVQEAIRVLLITPLHLNVGSKGDLSSNSYQSGCLQINLLCLLCDCIKFIFSIRSYLRIVKIKPRCRAMTDIWSRDKSQVESVDAITACSTEKRKHRSWVHVGVSHLVYREL